MITFADLQTDVLDWIDESTDTGATLRKVKSAINRSHRKVCLAQPWPWMKWPKEQSFTTEAGVRTYALNGSVGKILTLWDVSLNDWSIILPRRQWETQGVDRGSQNQYPRAWCFGPVWPVESQPNTGVVHIQSESASDTGGPAVILTGLDDGDTLVSETLTASGTSSVTSIQPFSHIMSITKTGTWVGAMNLYDHDNTLLVSLDPSDDGKLFQTLEAVQNPTAGQEFLYTFLRTPRKLENDGDLPEIYPNDLSEILVYGALLELSTYNSDIDEGDKQYWKDQYDALMKQLEEIHEETIIGSYPRTVREVDQTNRVRWVMEN